MTKEARALTSKMAIGLALLGLTVADAAYISATTCAERSRAMKLQHTWGFLQGCIVQYNGEFIPIEAIGVRTIELKK